MFLSDHSPDLPAGSLLLAELGIDPAAVREAIEDARAMRCPERPAIYPEHGFAGLFPEPAVGGFGEAVPPDRCPGQADEPWDPAASLPPA